MQHNTAVVNSRERAQEMYPHNRRRLVMSAAYTAVVFSVVAVFFSVSGIAFADANSGEEVATKTEAPLPPQMSLVDEVAGNDAVSRERYQQEVVSDIADKVNTPEYEQKPANMKDVMNALLGMSNMRVDYVTQKMQEMSELLRQIKKPPMPPKLPPIPPKMPPKIPQQIKYIPPVQVYKPPVIPATPVRQPATVPQTPRKIEK
jgi:hypothetical protein